MDEHTAKLSSANFSSAILLAIDFRYSTDLNEQQFSGNNQPSAIRKCAKFSLLEVG